MHPSQKYYKVDAFHVTPPVGVRTNISIDGEALDSDGGAFTVEVHRALGRTCALRGRWEGRDGFEVEKGLKMKM